MSEDILTTDPDIPVEAAAALDVTAAAEPEPQPEKRKRGRPRKMAAGQPEPPVEPPLDAPMPPRSEEAKTDVKSAPTPSQAWKLDGDTIGYGVCAVFGAIATATQHNHWLRDLEQVRPISDPLQRMFAKMPAAKRKQVMQILDPGILIAGIYQVAGPSIAAEIELAQGRQQGRIVSHRPAPSGASSPPAPSTSAAPEDPGKLASLQGQFVGAPIQ